MKAYDPHKKFILSLELAPNLCERMEIFLAWYVVRYYYQSKLYMSTNTICEHNIPDILFLRSFNLNSTCSARGNVSYLFFFLHDEHTTFYGRLHVLYVSTI